MAQLDDAITGLKAEVARNTTIRDSVLALLKGIPDLINTAVQAALAKGATLAQLKDLNDLSTGLAANDDAILAAVQANTPPVPTP